MSALLTILRAAHCQSTHHFFAIDALPLVQTDAGQRLKRILLRHHHRYLTGATDPDNRFRDFQNHVIHANEDYWGGAPRVAHSWYDRLQRYLRTDRYSDAAHAAGVLGHYFTDVMQPLHTQICDRERVVHRPIEYNINERYDTILRGWQEDEMRIVFQLSHRPGWLGEAMLHGARFAHRKRDLLLDGFDIERAARDPADGLNSSGRAALSELFGLAITGLARVLERAASDAESERGRPLPDVSLTLPAVLAGVRSPLRRLARWMAASRRRAAVFDLIDEFQSTQTLRQYLPVEVDIVHRVVDVYHDERRWKQRRRERLASKRTVVDVETTQDPAQQQYDETMPATIPFVRHEKERGSLSRDQALTDAPSIGPKTAVRFAAIDIHTVGDLLNLSAEVIAGRLQTYWLTAATVRQWQAQAMLMCQIPGLKECDTQLLAGSGYGSAAQILACDPSELHRDLSRFALTTSGRRYLRGSEPPSRLDVQRWIDDAGEPSILPESQRRAA